MSNTTPPRDDDDTVEPTAKVEPDTTDSDVETPVFDDVATEHPDADVVEAEIVDEPSGTQDTDQDTDASEPVPLIEPSSTRAEAPAERVVVAEPIVEDEVQETDGYEERVEEPVAAPAAPPVQTIYVTAPVAPRNKGNRGFGVLFALIALVAFALLFVGIMALVITAFFPGDFVERLNNFIGSTAFIIPTLVFVLAFILLVLIANRASWWAYVLGSFLVGLAVYFASIGVILLTANVFGMTPAAAGSSFLQLAVSPPIIIAAILAREVTIWFGAAIAARGRKVKVRNVETRAAYDREVAEREAQYGRA